MKRFMHALLYIGLGVLCFMSLKSMYGVVEKPFLYKDFKNILKKHALIVVYFANTKSIEENLPKKRVVALKNNALALSQARSQIDSMQKTLSIVSTDKKYERAHVVFIHIDVNRMPGVIQDYSLVAPSTLMLFKDGVPYEKQGIVAKTERILLNYVEIKKFIDSYFGPYIAEIIDYVDDQRSHPIKPPRSMRYAAEVCSNSMIQDTGCSASSNYDYYSVDDISSCGACRYYESPMELLFSGPPCDIFHYEEYLYDWHYPYYRRYYGYWGPSYGFGFYGSPGGFSGYGW